jgi:hypothetical protein
MMQIEKHLEEIFGSKYSRLPNIFRCNQTTIADLNDFAMCWNDHSKIPESWKDRGQVYFEGEPLISKTLGYCYPFIVWGQGEEVVPKQWLKAVFWGRNLPCDRNRVIRILGGYDIIKF